MVDGSLYNLFLTKFPKKGFSYQICLEKRKNIYIFTLIIFAWRNQSILNFGYFVLPKFHFGYFVLPKFLKGVSCKLNYFVVNRGTLLIQNTLIPLIPQRPGYHGKQIHLIFISAYHSHQVCERASWSCQLFNPVKITLLSHKA